MSPRRRRHFLRQCGGDGAFAFAPDPERSSSQQAIFWAPELLPTVLHLEPATGESSTAILDAIDFVGADIRRDDDGSHVLLRISGTTHRLWLPEEQQSAVTYEVRLPLDDFFDLRALAALRLWRALAGRRASEDPNGLTHQRRQRLTQALRALDAREDGATYRTIAEAMFGAKRIPERAWKTHDLRGRTIRLVASGYELMRGGYRKLLATFRRER
ncbi:MAG: DUF2285 domain-containing protein [Hyphomicrobiales bacterium]|nr:DUF2285 domain-containing protein [Hyphomicrobiales bacterium]